MTSPADITGFFRSRGAPAFVEAAETPAVREHFSRTSELPEAQPEISIVFPAFNEVANLPDSVAAARRAFSKHYETIEIVLVNDGSTDATGSLIDQLAADHDDVIAEHHAINQGYGAALRTGIGRAQGRLIFFSDADLQFDLEDIDRLRHWILSHDIVAGYREKRADPFVRILNAKAWNLLVRLVLGVRARDIDCAFKLFRAEIFDQIDIASAGAMINTEIFARANKLGLRVKEVPVRHFPRTAGEQTGANLRVVLKAFRELIGLYRVLR